MKICEKKNSLNKNYFYSIWTSIYTNSIWLVIIIWLEMYFHFTLYNQWQHPMCVCKMTEWNNFFFLGCALSCRSPVVVIMIIIFWTFFFYLCLIKLLSHLCKFPKQNLSITNIGISNDEMKFLKTLHIFQVNWPMRNKVNSIQSWFCLKRFFPSSFILKLNRKCRNLYLPDKDGSDVSRSTCK